MAPAVDKRCLLNPDQVAKMREWKGKRSRRGRLYRAFFASPTGKRVYDLRHTGLTTWLNGGIPQAEVAEWAGNSVTVLLPAYARCIVGQRDDYLRGVESLQDFPAAWA